MEAHVSWATAPLILAGSAWESLAQKVERVGLVLGIAAFLIITVLFLLVKIEGNFMTKKLESYDGDNEV